MIKKEMLFLVEPAL